MCRCCVVLTEDQHVRELSSPLTLVYGMVVPIYTADRAVPYTLVSRIRCSPYKMATT